MIDTIYLVHELCEGRLGNSLAFASKEQAEQYRDSWNERGERLTITEISFEDGH